MVNSFAGAPAGIVSAEIGGTLSGSSLLYTGTQDSSVLTSLGLYGPVDPSATVAFSGNTTASGLANPGNPYTLTETIVITANGTSLSSGDAHLDVVSTVPDSGATALLIGLGLAAIGLGAFAQRRQLAKV